MNTIKEQYLNNEEKREAVSKNTVKKVISF